MMFVRWFALAAVAVLSSPVTAGVVLTRSDKAVVLENELVRVELHRCLLYTSPSPRDS